VAIIRKCFSSTRIEPIGNGTTPTCNQGNTKQALFSIHWYEPRRESTAAITTLDGTPSPLTL